MLPKEITSKSISDKEIVLPLREALLAIDIFEQSNVHILGWEGWVKTSDGRIGQACALQGTASLQDLSVSNAAQLCKQTLKEDYDQWCKKHPSSHDQIHFCITVLT